MKKLLDTFEATDDIEVCRKCGVRTEVVKVFPTLEIHKCPACQYEYRLLIEPDEYEDDADIDEVPAKKSVDWK